MNTHDENRPTSTIAAKQRIEKSLRDNPTGEPKGTPKRLTRRQMSTEKVLFQTRTLEGNLANDQKHIGELGEIIGPDCDRKMLDPIEVWWGGDKYFVLDGHHRLIAYQNRKITKGIPVSVFKGTLDEAMSRAVYLNSKNKLPMTNEDRCNYAWKLVCVSKLSKSKIAKACGCSDRTVANMRVAKTKLIDEDGSTLEDIADLVWNKARSKASGWEQPSDHAPVFASFDL